MNPSSQTKQSNSDYTWIAKKTSQQLDLNL